MDRSGRHVEIEITDMPECMADPALIKQVYANLISNALKFTRRREIARIQIYHQDGAFVIKDNGVGFNTSNKDKLFGVFQRFHSSSEYEGTGVGLALVKKIITRHGGQIWVESEVDQGATFYFTLE
jgi:light-regulated signal transduction histidine kinase (bacteriophytochrome)